ncbi:DUF4962 domain-containing protein [Reichenbachiella sp. MALMAid0571]|uniref:DUF4962 domain-containing protein n=1 Tax=Reichenbachiella sp. MALMAid0571 TaxID=3143939 RepID=UPI0032DE41AD
MKKHLCFNFILLLFLLSCEKKTEVSLEVSSGEIEVNAKVIYPKSREWPAPSGGVAVQFNPPSLLWPVEKKADYSVRMSQSADFSTKVIEASGLPYAMYNPHQKLSAGAWYWQYKSGNGEWTELNTFNIDDNSKEFVTPEASLLLSMIPDESPRVYAWKSQLKNLRERAKDYEETKDILDHAEKILTLPLIEEKEVLPKFKGRNKRESRRIAIDASRPVCDRVQHIVSTLAQAYLLSNDKKYAETGVKWIMSLTNWDPEGPSIVSDFGDSGIMHAMAVGYDTFNELLSKFQKEKLLKAIAARGAHFYNEWPNYLESRLLSNHVWQHMLERFFQTALGVKGDLPIANEWLTYVYEIWLARSPVLGHKDGSWSNGISYFRMNTLTMLSITSTLKEITGVDFLRDEWYYNNPEWMIYAWPPNASADGFANDAYKLGNEEFPKQTNDPVFTAYVDLNSRLTGNPYAAWYADQRIEGTNKKLTDDPSLKWFYIQRGLELSRPKPATIFDLPQSRVFREVGVAYLNTDLANTPSNLMLAMKSSPYGSYSHTHAEHNCFNLFYAGKPLFSNTGYRPAMGDPHYLADFKNTRGHNGILINGMGQPFGSEAYGWIPRFINGDQISYVVGDATQAYDASDAEELKDEGNPVQNNKDAGLKRFRRHILMLKPSLVLIYDDLETESPSDFTFLLHNRNNLELKENKLTVANKYAKAVSTLFASTEVDQELSRDFLSPPVNWRRKKNPDGSMFEFENHFHYRAANKTKTNKMRFFAVIQIEPKNGVSSLQPVEVSENENVFKVGDWSIEAELNTEKAATLKVAKADGSVTFCSNGILGLEGKEYGTITGSSKLLEMIEGKPVFQEVVDELPESIANVLAVNKK